MNLISKDQKVLVLAPHTDDAEFGMGGTIARLIDKDVEVYQVNFSTAHDISQHGTRNNVLEKELMEATKEIGLNKKNVFLHDFPVRNFQEHRQKILDLLLYYKKKIKPDVVFVPSSTDIHQDHQAIHNEALRAFKHDTIFGYCLMWNNLSFNYDMFVHLELEHVNRKTSAIMKYSSQYDRYYSDRFKIMGWLSTTGLRCNADYAEAFEVVRINEKL